MCDPLTIAGMALSAGSAVANNAAANQQAKAQAAAMSAERSRQRVLDDEGRGVNEQARNRFEDIGAQQEQQASQLADVFSGEANRGADVISAALPRTSSNITMQNDEREREKATGFANQQGEAMARMRSFSDMFGGLGRDTAQDASQIGMLGGFKRGSQGVLPFELEAASMRGQGLRGAADIMSGLGGIGLTAGLSGASPFGRTPMSTNVVSGPLARSPIPPPRPVGLGGLY
jgi:hypothetical protein